MLPHDQVVTAGVVVRLAQKLGAPARLLSTMRNEPGPIVVEPVGPQLQLLFQSELSHSHEVRATRPSASDEILFPAVKEPSKWWT